MLPPYTQLCKPETRVIFDTSIFFTLHLPNSVNFISYNSHKICPLLSISNVIPQYKKPLFLPLTTVIVSQLVYLHLLLLFSILQLIRSYHSVFKKHQWLPAAPKINISIFGMAYKAMQSLSLSNLVLLSHFLLSTSATLAFFQFTEHKMLSPMLGSLHMLFRLPGFLFIHLSLQFSSSFFQISIKLPFPHGSLP